jgi:hypothetical protein
MRMLYPLSELESWMGHDGLDSRESIGCKSLTAETTSPLRLIGEPPKIL